MKFLSGIKLLSDGAHGRFLSLARNDSCKSDKESADNINTNFELAHLRVSFREEDDLVVEHAVPGNDEIDRTPTDNHVHDPARDDIFDELIDYIEKEMPVHKEAVESTKHGYLYGKSQGAKLHVQKRVREANKALGMKTEKKVLQRKCYPSTSTAQHTAAGSADSMPMANQKRMQVLSL